MGMGGEIRDLDVALLDVLAHYQPGQQGVHGLGGTVVVTLPVPNWAEFSWLEEGFIQVLTVDPAGRQVMFTVPQNERWILHTAVASRQSGDNTLTRLFVSPTSDYRTDAGTTGWDYLFELTTPVTSIWWPDPQGIQTGITNYTPPPLMMEPGTQFGLFHNAAGTVNTIWNYGVRVTRCRLVRVRAPEV